MVRLSAFADEISSDPVEQLDCLEANGVGYVELRSIHGTNVLDLAEQQHRDFRDLLRTRSMGLSAIGSPIGKIPITEPFEPHLVRFEHAMDLAAFYGTPRIRIFSYYMPDGASPDQFRDEVMRRMAAKARRAEARGIELLLENEKGIYGDVPDRVADLIETIDSPALRHAFDPANYLEVGVAAREAWQRLKPVVTHFHVKDYDTRTHKNVPAGEGEGQIAELIADAARAGFDGFCVLEPHLIVAEKSFGFTGPERFGDAARALKAGLRDQGVQWQ
jgi:sugar phosphate isomerase/epimerase